MFNIENEYLKIEVAPKGAELTRVFSKQTKLEYLWNGDPAFWGKHSPVLFPIVGTLKNDLYTYKEASYTLSRHGFARDMNFQLSAQTVDSLSFSLASNDQTRTNYPFDFALQISYTLKANRLTVHYQVVNTGAHEMFFSIGGHPAFNVPLDKNSKFEDYYLEFSAAETAGRWPISPEGLIEALPVALMQDTHRLPITHELFKQDALVFKYLQSTSVQLRSHTSTHGLNFHFSGFPFLGIWSARKANFVCIEPWCGIADSVASNRELVEKEGINLLTPGQAFSREWSIELF